MATRLGLLLLKRNALRAHWQTSDNKEAVSGVSNLIMSDWSKPSHWTGQGMINVEWVWKLVVEWPVTCIWVIEHLGMQTYGEQSHSSRRVVHTKAPFSCESSMHLWRVDGICFCKFSVPSFCLECFLDWAWRFRLYWVVWQSASEYSWLTTWLMRGVLIVFDVHCRNIQGIYQA